MKKLIKQLGYFSFVFMLCTYAKAYGFKRDKWSSKAIYDNIADSLSKYGAVNIYYKKTIELHEEESVFKIIYTIHQKTKIFNSEDIDRYSKFSFPYARFLDKIKARAIKQDGTIVDLKKSEIKFSNSNNKSKISGNSTKGDMCEFIVPGLVVGDEIEFMFSVVVPDSYSIDNFFFHSNTYTLNSEFTLICPYEVKVDYKMYNHFPSAKVVGVYVFKLIWTIYNKNLGGFLKSDSKLS